MMKRFMALTLTLVMVLTMIPFTAMAEEGVKANPGVFNDMPEDWSTEALVKALENGLLTGYDGKIMPKDNLTRAQMATIINRSFGATEKALITGFKDVDSSMWYFDDMAKAVQMKTFQGNDNKLNPDVAITREESFVVLARAFKLGATDKVPSGFNDLNDISSWAKGEIYSLIDAGYVAGSNGYINPQDNITRAEFAQVMHNILKTYIREAGEYTELPAGNVMVNVPGVTLKNVVVEGDLIVGDGVGDGDLILDHVEVKGRMVVRGGGENSIIIKGTSKVGHIIIARVDGAVRVVTEGDAEVEIITVDDGKDVVILEGTISKLTIQTETPVILRNANLTSITVDTQNAHVTVEEGTKVEELIVNEKAEDTKVVVEGSLKKATIEAPSTTLEGAGEVEKVSVKATANNTSIVTPNTEITTQKGVTGVTGTGGTEIPADSQAINNKNPDKPATVVEEVPPAGGGGGGGGGTPTPEAITITEATIGSGTAMIDGDTIDVNFTYGRPGIITATFNKAVTLQTIEIDGVKIDLVTGSPTTVDFIKSKISVSGKTLSIDINSIITEEHLEVFGNQVEVEVTDGTSSKTITINLIGEN